MNFDVSILDEYHNAWNISSSKNNEELRSCEQKLIKLEIEELHKLLNPLKWAELHILCDSDQIYKTCILLHLIRLFSIPGEEEEEEEEEEEKEKKKEEYEDDEEEEEEEDEYEDEEEEYEDDEDEYEDDEDEYEYEYEDDEDEYEDDEDEYEDVEEEEEKIKIVQDHLNKVLHNLSEKMLYSILDRFISQQLKFKSELTEMDLLTGQIDPYYEFWLKLCYWDTFLVKSDKDSCVKFLKQNRFFFIHTILSLNIKEYNKAKFIFCKIVLCFLKWDICTSNIIPHPVLIAFQRSIIKPFLQDFNMSDLLHFIFLTLSEDNISTAFKDYLNQMYAMKIEITEDDFYSGEIEPYQEFLLKLCYFEKLCDENDDETCNKFIKRNADFLVPLINMVELNKTKTKLISCKVMSCLSKWGIPNQKTAWTHLFNILRRKYDNKVCPSCMNENTFFILSMVDTVMASNDVKVMMIFCDFLLCIPYNQLHFHDVTDAVNKLIRHYAKPFRIGDKICQWIIELGFRFLKHLYDMQKLGTAKKIIVEDFKKYFNLIEDLFTDSCHDRRRLELNINHFRDNKYSNQCFQCDYCMHRSVSSEEQDETRLKELWIDKIKCKVKALKILNKKRKKGKEVSDIKFENLIPMKIFKLNVAISEGNFIDEWEANIKEDQLDAKNMEDQINAIYMDEQIMKRLKLHEMLVLLMMLLIVIAGTSTGHHKSAKLKKYLTLKYEYDTAILYLLWCSGDIEVHPGPHDLEHDSSIERRWISNICKQLENRLSKKFKSTKERENDRDKREHFKTLLKTSLEETVHVPKKYLAEIDAWESKAYKLLDKLFIYQCEIKTILTSLQDFLTSSASIKDLSGINVSFETELNKTNELAMVLRKYQRPKVNIPRHLAGILIKCAHGKNPNAKCDGLFDLPLKNWPKDQILFDPNNRGKYLKRFPGQNLIPDQKLVDILLTLPQLTIPEKYKPIMDAYKTMRKNQKDKSINKQHKAELCSTFKRIINLVKIDNALKNLWESGIFTKEVHNSLNKWWTTRVVDTTDDNNCSQVDIYAAGETERPHILINVSTKSMTLTVKQTDANSSQVSYDFPFDDDELVPLKTMATTVHHTTIQKPSSDSCQMVNAKIYLTVLPKPDACPVDNQINLIIIPPDEMTVLNSYFPCDIYPDSQAILESDIKHQHRMSSQETALYSTIESHQPISSTNQFSQLNQDILISGQPGPILCTPNQSTTNSNDISSATKDSQNPDFHMQVSPTSDIGSSDSISSVNSESGNEDGDQINIPNGGHVLMTDSDYSSDSSNICVSKPNMKKRKCMEEDRNEMKKRKVPSLKQDKKPKETNHMYRKDDSSMDKSIIFNTNMELLQDCLQIDLDSFDFDDQTFDVKLNALDNQDKNRQICDKDRNFMNGETQISKKNTNVSVYDTNVSSDLERFLQEMIYIESEKISQTKTSLTEV